MRRRWRSVRRLLVHVAVLVMHGRSGFIRSTNRGLGSGLLVAVRQRRHLMRQTTCPRHERRQRRGLKQDPRGREQTKVPADECHSDSDQLNKAPRPKPLGEDSPQFLMAQPAPLSRSRFPAKTGSLSSRACADLVNAYAPSTSTLGRHRPRAVGGVGVWMIKCWARSPRARGLSPKPRGRPASSGARRTRRRAPVACPATGPSRSQQQ
jgi:hypothetical protein